MAMDGHASRVNGHARYTHIRHIMTTRPIVRSGTRTPRTPLTPQRLDRLGLVRHSKTSLALVAQGIEHGSPKAGVAGSNPAGGTLVFAQFSDGFQMSADWPRLVLVGAVVGDWLASAGAAWPAIVNRVASADDERAGVLHQQHQMQRIGRRRPKLEVGVERADLIVRHAHKTAPAIYSRKCYSWA